MSPPAPVVDLFSDTVTRPTGAMRRYMCDAEVGDEQQLEDPTVNRLQETVAALLGKEAALFLPSGTMCNQVAFAVHCRAGDEILLHETAHPLLYEAGGAAALIGAVFRPLPGPRGRYTPGQVREAVRPRVHYMPRSRVVSIEQTANIVGGVCWPLDEVEGVCAAARELGLVCHMDGARLLNAVVATGTPARSFAASVDSVWRDLTKGLGAPVGAVLAGSRTFIEEAWVFKQRLGGAMRQAGIIAAGGLYALQHHVERLAEDHERARRLAAGLAEVPGIAVDAERVETNIVIFDVRGTGLSGEAFAARTLASHGVRFSVLGSTTVRAVTHLDVPPDGIERALDSARAAAPRRAAG
ncbi:MAG TPA: GntG family PLP-dependent aldolase [Gemmatimonadales bacterium]|nr:GntG family PLP-dependent aldolase [Gemmatimonadales bacterium]